MKKNKVKNYNHYIKNQKKKNQKKKIKIETNRVKKNNQIYLESHEKNNCLHDYLSQNIRQPKFSKIQNIDIILYN